MTPEELDEIEQRCNAATDAPWSIDTMPEAPYMDNITKVDGNLVSTIARCFHKDGNANFIAHARQDVPMLIKTIRRLLQEREDSESWTEYARLKNQLEKAHKDIEYCEREWRKEACLLTEEIKELQQRPLFDS